VKVWTIAAVIGASACAQFWARGVDAAEPPASEPASTREMKEHFKRGVELFDEADYKLALIEFERAYSLSSSYKILYNIGQVQSQLGQYANAFRSLERYLAEGGDRVSADRRAEVERDKATLKSRTALLTVRGTNGADISMDGEPLGKTPITSLRVNAGEHRIVSRKAEFVAQEQHVVFAGGDVAQLDFSLVAVPVQLSQRPDRRPAAWVTWAGAGVLGAGAAVTGLMALNSASELKSMRDTVGSSAADRANEADKARTLSIVSDVLLGAAVVTGGIALYLTFKKPSAEQSARNVRLTFGLSSLSATGAF